MLEGLRIVAGSWPLAVIVVGLAAAYVARRSIAQVLRNRREAEADRAHGNNAVVVQRRAAED